jgi:hypothetical protein
MAANLLPMLAVMSDGSSCTVHICGALIYIYMFTSAQLEAGVDGVADLAGQPLMICMTL